MIEVIGLGIFNLIFYDGDFLVWGILAVNVFFIIWSCVKAKQLKDDILQGDFQLVRSRLTKTEEETRTDGDGDQVSSFFLIYSVNGDCYRLRTNAGDFDKAKVGRNYYLVLHKESKQGKVLFKAYDAESYLLDEELTKVLIMDNYSLQK